MTPAGFQSEQAVQLARAFEEEAVDYLFIGKGAAILLGYPFVTQELDLEYLERFRQEYERLHAPAIRTAAEIAQDRLKSKR